MDITEQNRGWVELFLRTDAKTTTYGTEATEQCYAEIRYTNSININIIQWTAKISSSACMHLAFAIRPLQPRYIQNAKINNIDELIAKKKKQKKPKDEHEHFW